MGIFEGFTEGYKTWSDIRDTKRKNKLAAEYQQIENQNAPTKFGLANDLSQTEIENKKITNKYLPETLSADAAFKRGMLQHYMTQASMERGMSPIGKAMYEQGLAQTGNLGPGLPGGIAGGKNPNNNIPGIGGVPGDKALKDKYDAYIQKQTSDSNTRKRAQYAINIDKTIDTIDTTPITYYSGVEGAARLKADQIAAVSGKTTPQYQAYNNFVKVQVPALIQQVRQFYGTSIQPEVQKELEQLVDPIHWYSNPDLAMTQYNQFVNLMGRETSTYLDTLNAPIKPIERKEKAAPVKQDYSKMSDAELKKLAGW